MEAAEVMDMMDCARVNNPSVWSAVDCLFCRGEDRLVGREVTGRGEGGEVRGRGR